MFMNNINIEVVKMLNDVTDQRLVEERMAHLAAIVDSSDDAIISKTLEGIITSWNDAAERIFGYTATEAIGQPITMLIPPDRLQEEPLIVERIRRGERVDHFETKRITKDRRLLDISLTISPIRDRRGRVTGASKIARDITAQKEAERRLREAEERFRERLEKTVGERTRELVRINEELERSNHELEQYAYIASHDLQEPLRKIQTFAELLKMNIHDAEAIEAYYGKINDTAKRMSGLIKDVLNYSRLSKSDIAFCPVDLNEVWQDVLSDFELLIEQKKAIVDVGPQPVIQGDASQLRQLFGNLVSNSLKFCEQAPHIQVRATTIHLPDQTIKDDQASGSFVEIILSDNGIGFEQQYADQIFVVFKRLNSRQFYSGTGIGLALCKKIVERHGGAISASSKPGKGAVFTILLPVAAAGG